MERCVIYCGQIQTVRPFLFSSSGISEGLISLFLFLPPSLLRYRRLGRLAKGSWFLVWRYAMPFTSPPLLFVKQHRKLLNETLFLLPLSITMGCCSRHRLRLQPYKLHRPRRACPPARHGRSQAHVRQEDRHRLVGFVLLSASSLPLPFSFSLSRYLFPLSSYLTLGSIVHRRFGSAQHQTTATAAETSRRY
jgi:hypothetical protein